MHWGQSRPLYSLANRFFLRPQLFFRAEDIHMTLTERSVSCQDRKVTESSARLAARSLENELIRDFAPMDRRPNAVCEQTPASPPSGPSSRIHRRVELQPRIRLQYRVPRLTAYPKPMADPRHRGHTRPAAAPAARSNAIYRMTFMTACRRGCAALRRVSCAAAMNASAPLPSSASEASSASASERLEGVNTRGMKRLL